jgi:hypothetical protein
VTQCINTRINYMRWRSLRTVLSNETISVPKVRLIKCSSPFCSVTTLPGCMRLLRSNMFSFYNYFCLTKRSYVCVLSDLSLLQVMCVLHILYLSLQVRSPPQTSPLPYLPGTSHPQSRIMFCDHGKSTSVVAEHGAPSSSCLRLEGPSFCSIGIKCYGHCPPWHLEWLGQRTRGFQKIRFPFYCHQTTYVIRCFLIQLIPTSLHYFSI